ncbi:MULTISPECIES: dienelactone hydrolase family protein [unclassified Streptomyces]|uniref:dienelactone hydrolase family protein n=1 Tax=unclassified Streptomyces TaxID=2593676 RepID=UPI000AAFC486|nr:MULTISPECIES: alpha/beta hydrolase [unclassified Streptomyces]
MLRDDYQYDIPPVDEPAWGAPPAGLGPVGGRPVTVPMTAEGPWERPGGEVAVPVGPARLAGRLVLSPGAGSLVVLAHGSGCSRHSPRNRRLAAALGRAGLGTLLLDLLTSGEERLPDALFDIPLLAGRLGETTRWLGRETGLPVGLLGAGTTAGAVLEAAAWGDAHAVVCCGGRPDLAGPAALARVRAPTLFVVGALDARVLGLNRLAAGQLRCEHRLAVVPGATRLFTEPGALDAVARLAAGWFTAHRPVRV